MKIKNTTFIQKHIEKIVLASAVGLFLMVATYYLLGIPAQPFAVKISIGKQVKALAISEVPDQLQKKAEELRKKIDGKSPVYPNDYMPPKYPTLLSELRATPVISGASLPAVWGDFPLGSKDTGLTDVALPHYFLPHPPVPSGAKVVAGNVVLASGEDSVYVSVEATLDLPVWYKRMLDTGNLRKSGQEPLSSQIAKQGLHVAGVYLEREQWEPDRRAFGKPVRITTEGHPCYFEEQAAWNTMDENDREKAVALIKSIKDNQPKLQRPDFPALDPVSPAPLLREEVPVPVAENTALPTKDDTASQDKAQPVRLWVHDLTAESGKKYRYRLVATVLNPLYNLPDKSMAKELVLRNATKVALAPQAAEVRKAPWVEVVIPRNFHCFFTETAGIRAKFEVWKVVSGQWVGQTFEAKVGDAIGSKQAMVTFPGGNVRPVDLDSHKILVDILDVPDPEHGDRKVKAALLMNADGTLETRYASQDLSSSDRKMVQGRGDAPAPATTPGDFRQKR